VYLYEFLKK